MQPGRHAERNHHRALPDQPRRIPHTGRRRERFVNPHPNIGEHPAVFDDVDVAVSGEQRFVRRLEELPRRSRSVRAASISA
jgi:hypothetical protein